MNTVWFAGGGTRDAVPDPSRLVLDRAFRFGMSIFETVAVWGGRPVLLEAHTARLELAARTLLGVVPDFLDELAAAASARISGRTGVMRLYVTAGPGAPDAPAEDPLGVGIFEDCEVGAGPGDGVGVSIARLPYVAAPGGWKTGNYWANARALAEARREGFRDAVLVAPHGEVVSGAISNLFAVIGGRLVTPRTEAGARPGVVREWVLARAGGEEAVLDPSALVEAEEVFLTNSRAGIVSVAAIDGHAIPGRDRARWLARAYRDEILHG